VAVFISSSGQPNDLVRAASLAVERGASVIAITASKSPLAKKATVCIPVDHTEDSSTFIAMISRILHLLVIDMVSVGVAVRRSPSSPMSQLGAGLEVEGAVTPAPGVLISHVV
jgi:glucokinase